MKTFVMIIAASSLALTGIACGGGSPCEDAEAAAISCQEATATWMAEAGIESTDSTESASICGTAEGDAIPESVYNCIIAAYGANDCSTQEGATAAIAAASACATFDENGEPVTGDDHEGEDHEDHEGEDHEGEDHEGEDHEGEEAAEGDEAAAE